MLVLLIVFMISAPLMQQGVQVDLPKTNAGALSDTPDQLLLTLAKNRQVSINGNAGQAGHAAREARGGRAGEARRAALHSGRSDRALRLRRAGDGRGEAGEDHARGARDRARHPRRKNLATVQSVNGSRSRATLSLPELGCGTRDAVPRDMTPIQAVLAFTGLVAVISFPTASLAADSKAKHQVCIEETTRDGFTYYRAFTRAGKQWRPLRTVVTQQDEVFHLEAILAGLEARRNGHLLCERIPRAAVVHPGSVIPGPSARRTGRTDFPWPAMAGRSRSVSTFAGCLITSMRSGHPT